MPIRMMDQGRKCGMTGIGDVVLYVQELRDRRTLELAAALVSESEESDRPAVFLSLLISRAGMKPYWTFTEAGKLPQSARDDAVEIFIVESPNCNAFLAQPQDCSLEIRLYNVYREQLESITVTDELLASAKKVKNRKPLKDSYADMLAKAAMPSWLTAQTQASHAAAISSIMGANQALLGPLSSSLDSTRASMIAAAAGIPHHQDLVGPISAALLRLNGTGLENLSRSAQAQLLGITPKLVDPSLVLPRYHVESLHYPGSNPYSLNLLETIMPAAALKEQLQRLTRLEGMANPAALITGMLQPSDLYTRPVELMRSSLQDLNQSIAGSLASMATQYQGLNLQSNPALSASYLGATLLTVPLPADYSPKDSRPPRRQIPQADPRKYPPDESEMDNDRLYRAVFDLLIDKASDASVSLDILHPLLKRLERRVQIALNQQRRFATASTTNGARILEARARFNWAWYFAFPVSREQPLNAAEIEVGGLFRDVTDQDTFSCALGCLEIVSSDGGMNQRVFDAVTPRLKSPGSSEKPLKHLERILYEVAGLTESQAQTLMTPLFRIRDLRNAYPPMHSAGSEGRKAFASIGHTLPPTDPTICWNDITDMYANGLNAIAVVLRKFGGANAPNLEV